MLIMIQKPNFSIAQVGPYPPPYGGVSVHIKRLHQRLKQDKINSQVYCDPNWVDNYKLDIQPRKLIIQKPWSYFSWLFEPGYKVDAKIIHLHYAWCGFAPSVVAMLTKGKKIIITAHNQMEKEDGNGLSLFKRLAGQALVRSSSVYWIAVSERVRSLLSTRGVSAERLCVIPAFLPPDPVGELLPEYPPGIQKFIRAHTPLLSAYGFRLWLDSDGQDVYGFDLCIDLLRALKTEYPHIGLIICVPDVQLHDYYAKLKQRISEYDLVNNVMFITEPLEEAYPLWKASDVYIRPTNTDGDSIAVREALSLEVPVVASDASPRPDGVVLFSCRNLASFLSAVRKVLQESDAIKHMLSKSKLKDNYVDILALYKQVAASRP